MPSITTLLRSLGNDGALANVEAVLEERQRQDWLVAGLTRRIAANDHARAAAAAAAQPASAAA
jgi:hypothetical protein